MGGACGAPWGRGRFNQLPERRRPVISAASSVKRANEIPTEIQSLHAPLCRGANEKSSNDNHAGSHYLFLFCFTFSFRFIPLWFRPIRIRHRDRLRRRRCRFGRKQPNPDSDGFRSARRQRRGRGCCVHLGGGADTPPF